MIDQDSTICYGLVRDQITLSSFSKLSARRGFQPSMASPATAESHDGHAVPAFIGRSDGFRRTDSVTGGRCRGCCRRSPTLRRSLSLLASFRASDGSSTLPELAEAPAGFRTSPEAVLPMTQPIPHLVKENRVRFSVSIRIGGREIRR